MDMDVRRDLRSAVAPFESPFAVASLVQFLSTLLLYVGCCALMYRSLSISYALTLALAFPAAAFLTRLFIIQHDCGHGSFFRSERANTLVGRICSVITLAPYDSWRRQHALHHANWNNLDRRESGTDIYSAWLTVREFRALSPWRRFLHRAVRHPLIAHGLLPPAIFLILYRVPFDTPKHWRRERRSVHATNAAIAAAVIALGWFLGFGAVAAVQLPIVVVSTVAGVWLFGIQHRFDAAQYFREAEWSFAQASLQGSSYLKLPRLLQWSSGNIGFHHIHHLAPRVPNYRLESCYRSNPLLQAEPPLTLRRALRSIALALWDERQQKFVAFADAK
ncbi:MAG TPA: fatty acid desaturase [Rhizomicrobium sp.]|jgi:omega-6 fatty acid desaturase (delta-12 desaturase)|nr:fatty acid desaturase [Rhizomicrobium sp.]